MSNVSKTYVSNKELGLNLNGVRVPHQHKGAIRASAPGSPNFVANDGGHIRPYSKQTGWRVRCAQVGTSGGFEISVGNHQHRTILPGMAPVDFTLEELALVRVEHIGMLSREWGALVISRVF